MVSGLANLFTHQVKHVLHVDKALLDDSVEGANVVERRHQLKGLMEEDLKCKFGNLHEVGAQQYKVTDRQPLLSRRHLANG